MNYPVWYMPSIGGGTIIATIAIIHVFISHFAVGGGFWLVLLEGCARHRRDGPLYRFTRNFARFFLFATLVCGALTGVGIWFAISLIQPAGTSALIHRFVFVWAAEWVLFLVEIVSIIVYLHTFDRLSSRRHLAIGGIYCAASWLSLFAINGIITFMLTPGDVARQGEVFSAFFNPTFFPSLLLRTCLAILLSGLFVTAVAAFSKDRPLARRLIRIAGAGCLVALGAALPAVFWYLKNLPAPVRILVEGASPTIVRSLAVARPAAAILSVGALLALWRPGRIGKPAAMIGLAAGLLLMGSFEWTREAARRPYVLQGSIYSNGQRADRPLKEPFLSSTPWSKSTEPGRELFKFQCYACHTLGGINNDILQRTQGMDAPALEAYISQLHAIRPFMPPFIGSPDERRDLAVWLANQQRSGSKP